MRGTGWDANDCRAVVGCGCVRMRKRDHAVAFRGKDEIVYRFKGFDSAHCGDNMHALEQLVNVWMEAEQPRIRQMCQSVRGEHILLSFVYEETHDLEQRLAAQTATTALPRYFEDDFADDRSTGGRIPATPPPMH